MMNNLIEKLHTAARRYCTEKYQEWAKRYTKIVEMDRHLDGDTYTDEALRVFPRYNVLNAILIEVEGFTPQDFSTLEEAKDLISIAGHTAEDILTKDSNNSIAIGVMDEEIEKFIKYIQSISEAELSTIETMPYRRVLKKGESQWIWSDLKDAWDLKNGYWYPLANCNDVNISAFQDKYFQTEVGSETIRGLLEERDIIRVWELREYGPEYELELAAFDPNYNGAEGYWCSADMDWIIYASHESSITLGGWLLTEVKKVWQNWEERIWTTPFFN